MPVDVLLGLQWGDEGKGKLVDALASRYDIVARFQGGPNAGHTIVANGSQMVLHQVPSGILNDTENLIGSGVVLDPIVLKNEIEALKALGVDAVPKLRISMKAHLILPTHKILDAASEAAKGAGKIGSTLRGITPAYMDKTGRNGLRAGEVLRRDFRQSFDTLKQKHLHLLKLYDFEFNAEELESDWFEGIEILRRIKIVSAEHYMNDALDMGKRVLAEGAQGALLDVDHGTYPFVTSSNTITAGALTGLGIPPHRIGEVIGVFKAYCTRVGSGPFPSELTDTTGDKLRQIGNEYGATTGRPRRCGWLDLPALRYTTMLCGVSALAMTKADVLNDFEAIEICTGYDVEGEVYQRMECDPCKDDIKPVSTSMPGWATTLDGIHDFDELPKELADYITFIERQVGKNVDMISTGAARESLIQRQVNSAF
jgi:adenylosuccinate synthase